jgi:hypothetical protein
LWADNETSIDLCGFGYLVDQLELVLSDSTLRPVTVGLSGGWGSGKSSLMKMAQDRLETDERNVCCSFSPWRFEDYDDIKHSLMVTVLDALQRRVPEEGAPRQTLKKVRKLAERLRLAKLAVTGGLMVAGADPLSAGAAGEAAQGVVAATGGVGDEEGVEGLDLTAFVSAREFRDQFEALIGELGAEVAGIYVFVDDLDRCLPETVVDTFEAIRLFLHVPNTAYVVAADPTIVRAAISSRYAELGIKSGDVGTDYLEKIWQFTVSVPPLATPEVETYVSLLFAQLDLDETQFRTICSGADEHRRSDPLSVAMNFGKAGDILGEIPESLKEHLALTSRIAPQLSEGLRGNPREIKRFLNTLLLKRRAAGGRDIELKPDVLAKLLILEERHVNRFRELYEWQLEAEGAPAALGDAERLARNEQVESPADGAKEWAEDSGLATWLRLEPQLTEVTLGPYFSYARDKLVPTAATSRLPGNLQKLLVQLVSSSDSARTEAVSAAKDLDPSSRHALFDVAAEMVVRKPEAPALRALAEIAKADDSLVGPLQSVLEQIPRLPAPTEAHFKTVFGKDEQRFDEIFAARKKRR